MLVIEANRHIAPFMGIWLLRCWSDIVCNYCLMFWYIFYTNWKLTAFLVLWYLKTMLELILLCYCHWSVWNFKTTIYNCYWYYTTINLFKIQYFGTSFSRSSYIGYGLLLGLWCLMPLSAIFQLYNGGQLYIIK